MLTEWRAGPPGYEVSSFGQVRNKATGYCLRGSVTQGYRVVTIAGRTLRVHVLVCETFHGARPPGLCACHRDGNALNNAASNLYWGSLSDNSQDAVRHGTHTQARKAMCLRGHLLVGSNLRDAVLRKGGRDCRSCFLARQAVRNARKRGKPVPGFHTEANRRYVEIIGGGPSD